MGDIIDFFKFILFIIIGFGLVVILIVFGIMYPVSKWDCAAYSQGTGLETRFVAPTRCFIRVGDEWLTEGQYKAQMMAKQGLRGTE